MSLQESYLVGIEYEGIANKPGREAASRKIPFDVTTL
jgi:hypothetical protein